MSTRRHGRESARVHSRPTGRLETPEKPTPQVATRERLIEAAIGLFRNGAMQVTTAQITTVAGVTQSAFYRHFPTLDEFLTVAAQRVGSEVRELIAAERQQVFEGPEHVPATWHYESILRFARHNLALAEMLIKRRFDPSPLGIVFRQLLEQLRIDLFSDLCETFPSRRKAGDSHRQRVADLLVGLTLAAVERAVSGQFDDREAAELVARAAMAMVEDL